MNVLLINGSPHKNGCTHTAPVSYTHLRENFSGKRIQNYSTAMKRMWIYWKFCCNPLGKPLRELNAGHSAPAAGSSVPLLHNMF